jgi:phospholipid/cholesterol/gamma-HCH transport system substrate-binding protein
MTERQLQFRVGLFVVFAMAVGAGLIMQFGNLKDLLQETYPLAIHFEEVPGLHPGSPVRQNGISIGSVTDILPDDEQGGVLVVVKIQGQHSLRSDSQPRIARSLFGDAKIEFSPGKATQILPPRTRLEGRSAADPMQVVERMERSVNATLTSFEATSNEWRKVGSNLNELMDTNRGSLNEVIERTAGALDSFHLTMQAASETFSEAGQALKTATSTLTNANSLITDPQLQKNLRQTAAALPALAEETRLTIVAARASMEQVSRNLDTIQQASLPLAQESGNIVRNLSGSLIQLEALLTEMNQFSKAINNNEGSLQKFASDPSLYQNLNRSAAELSALLTNLEPTLRDIRIFSDRVARHPELLGISGAMRGSSGLKEDSEIQQAGFSTPGTQR